MKSWIFKSFVFLLPFSLCAQNCREDISDDQLSYCVGGSFYLVSKAISIAQDYDCSYVKILSYELDTELGRLSFTGTGDYPDGVVVESTDIDGTIKVACFRQNTNNCFCICLDDYESEDDDQ